MTDQRRVTRKMLKEGISLETGYHHVLRLVGDKLHLRLDIDPADASTIDEKFVLVGLNGSARAYEQTRTTKDDVEQGDRFLDLIYTDLVPDLTYSLEIETGNGQPKHICFEDVPWSELEGVLRY